MWSTLSTKQSWKRRNKRYISSFRCDTHRCRRNGLFLKIEVEAFLLLDLFYHTRSVATRKTRGFQFWRRRTTLCCRLSRAGGHSSTRVVRSMQGLVLAVRVMYSRVMLPVLRTYSASLPTLHGSNTRSTSGTNRRLLYCCLL